MPETKFIFNRLEKEAEDTVARILDVVQKKPYPDQNTTVLASFVHALFQTNIKEEPKQEKKPEPQKPAMSAVMQMKPLPPPPNYMPKPTMPAIQMPPAMMPVPETGLLAKETTLLPATMDKPFAKPKEEEYTIKTFGTEVKVMQKPDESGKPTYKLIEPEINEKVMKLTKEYIEDDFEKDYNLLDNKEYMNKKIEKACKKSDVVFNEGYANVVLYYLKRDLLGFRRIDALMYDNSITAIYCDGLNKPVTVDIKNVGKTQTNIVFTDAVDLNALLYKIARASNSKLSDSKPVLDTEFQGYKIQAVLGIGGMSSKLIIRK
ncbi:MAG: hypothetical protein KJ955_04275 [Nanoarchaeota archaeon]|nr:hypothetical protein [Nanoarchaeota archaeon]